MNALCQVLDQAGQLCMHTAVLHPTNMQKLIAATLDDGRSGVTADDRNRWAAVTQSLQLRCVETGSPTAERCASQQRAYAEHVHGGALVAEAERAPLLPAARTSARRLSACAPSSCGA